jgi:hypothetical protein
MPYPYNPTDTVFGSSNNGCYADIQAVQAHFSSFRIENDDSVNERQIHQFLIYVSREIDACLLKAGVQVPPPPGAAILPILQETCALGAAALVEHTRFEAGEEDLGKRSAALQNSYDAMMGMLERGDINLIALGCIDAGWATTPNRTLYYSSGNLLPKRDGTAKQANFQMGTQQW